MSERKRTRFPLREELDAARAEVARLELLAAQATCAEIGHRFKCIGGANAGCGTFCSCSIPVHECEVCGESDYGNNPLANEVREECRNRPA